MCWVERLSLLDSNPTKSPHPGLTLLVGPTNSVLWKKAQSTTAKGTKTIAYSLSVFQCLGYHDEVQVGIFMHISPEAAAEVWNGSLRRHWFFFFRAQQHMHTGYWHSLGSSSIHPAFRSSQNHGAHRHIAQAKAKLLTDFFSLQVLQHCRRLKHSLLGFLSCGQF